jgi:hypothetical protein
MKIVKSLMMIINPEKILGTSEKMRSHPTFFLDRRRWPESATPEMPT